MAFLIAINLAGVLLSIVMFLDRVRKQDLMGYSLAIVLFVVNTGLLIQNSVPYFKG